MRKVWGELRKIWGEKSLNLIDINKSKIVKKHNALLLSRFNYSLSTLKLISMLISSIRVEDENFQEYHIKICDFAHLIESKSKNMYFIVHSIINEILSNPIKIEDEQFNFCYYAKYEKGCGAAVFKIAPELRPYLLSLKKDFFQYQIKNIMQLKSTYSIRFYELLISKFNEYIFYHPNSKIFTYDVKIDDIIEIFQIPTSQKYNDIKRNIINKSQTEFKNKTDIKFDYTEKKIGKKVVSIIITISKNQKGSNDPLSNIRAFISYIRKNFVNADIYHVQNKQCISCNSEGKLYCKYSTKKIDPKRSNEIWKKLYNIAKEKEHFEPLYYSSKI